VVINMNKKADLKTIVGIIIVLTIIIIFGVIIFKKVLVNFSVQ